MTAAPSTDIASYDPSGGTQGVVIGQHVDLFVGFAKTLAMSDMLPDGLRGKPANVFMALMQGLDLGLRPMQAINLIDVIKGKPCMSAQGMRAQINAAGHRFRILDNTDAICRMAAHRSEWPDDEWPEVSFSIEQAKQAGLTGDNWKKYPADMLLARATSRMAKAYFSDVTNGMNSVEELVDVPASRTLAEVAKERGATKPKPAAAEPDDDAIRQAVLDAAAGTAEPEPEDAVIVTACDVCGGEGDHDISMHDELGIPVQDTL